MNLCFEMSFVLTNYSVVKQILYTGFEELFFFLEWKKIHFFHSDKFPAM